MATPAIRKKEKELEIFLLERKKSGDYCAKVH
jgi:hypothetical protein